MYVYIFDIFCFFLLRIYGKLIKNTFFLDCNGDKEIL